LFQEYATLYLVLIKKANEPHVVVVICW